MSGSKMTIKPKPKPTDLFCEDCLEELSILKASDPTYYCRFCRKISSRKKVLTFDEMTNAKFERAKRKAERMSRGKGE